VDNFVKLVERLRSLVEGMSYQDLVDVYGEEMASIIEGLIAQLEV
jgi:hypothetical protein